MYAYVCICIDLHRHVFKRCRSLSLVQYYHQMTVYYTVGTVHIYPHILFKSNCNTIIIERKGIFICER